MRSVAERMGSFSWHGIPGPAALLLAGDIYLRLDWFRQARQCYEDYIKSFPEDLDAKRKLGLVLLMLDEDALAERVLLAVARRERFRVAETLSYQAMLEAKSGRLEESCHLLLQARELDPSDKRIEQSLLRMEALRVRLKRKAMQPGEMPFEALVPAMVTGMLELHGYSGDTARRGRELWEEFCEKAEPHGRKPAIWAAAVEYAITRNVPHYSQEQLAVDYGVSASQLREHFRDLCAAVDVSRYQSRDLLADAAEEGGDLRSRVRSEELADLLGELSHHLSGMDGPGAAVGWVLERLPDVSERERREVEDFVRYLWERHAGQGSD
ncbi:hypothetical protein JW921_10400 [Candidatus Fermentibacterales bacterium]|nr:hypothetical protein [Candidatus Fermentibacterales bacterium]